MQGERMGEGDLGVIGAGLSMGSCGFCAPVRRGRICRSATERIKRCIGAFSTGASKESSRRCCKAWPEICTNEEDSISPSVCGRQLFSGQKGGAKVGKTKRGKGCKIMAVGDAHGLPIAIHTETAAPAEVKLV